MCVMSRKMALVSCEYYPKKLDRFAGQTHMVVFMCPRLSWLLDNGHMFLSSVFGVKCSYSSSCHQLKAELESLRPKPRPWGALRPLPWGWGRGLEAVALRLRPWPWGRGLEAEAVALRLTPWLWGHGLGLDAPRGQPWPWPWPQRQS